jgi:Zn-dependent protease with chaperone function
MNLRRFAAVVALCLLLPVGLGGCAKETPAEHAANVYAQQEVDAAAPYGNVPDYSLPAGELATAQHLTKLHMTMHFAEEIWDIVSLLLLLGFGVIGWMRDVAVRFRSRWVQGYVFLGLYLAAGTLLSLPLDLYEQHLELKYALSVQGWGSWFGDQAKTFGLMWVFGGLVVMLLFWIIRRAPRRWWLVFWVCSIPIVFFGIYVAPYIEPIFYHYEPLQATQPALVSKLEEIVQKGHMDIPPERMFLMKASAKVTTLNADVEGFGASKRVVVWDNTIAKATPDEILLVFGHESGHYVLGHIRTGVGFSILLLLVMLYLGYHFVQGVLRQFGARWHIPAQEDWAALAILMLAFSLFGSLTEPLQNAFSRSHEHAADVYGQEAIHGIVADPQAAAKGAFDVLGETSLADPNPNQLYEFWSYSHPAIGRRAAFAHAYDPWAPGMEPKYFGRH